MFLMLSIFFHLQNVINEKKNLNLFAHITSCKTCFPLKMFVAGKYPMLIKFYYTTAFYGNYKIKYL